MKYLKFTIAIISVLLAVCCTNASAAGKEDVKAIKGIEGQAYFAVSASFEENAIVLSEAVEGTVLNEIPIACDTYKVFINMMDERNGYMLYYSILENDQIKKYFYITRDRWSTYSEICMF